jgi:hypothetical protein
LEALDLAWPQVHVCANESPVELIVLESIREQFDDKAEFLESNLVGQSFNLAVQKRETVGLTLANVCNPNVSKTDNPVNQRLIVNVVPDELFEATIDITHDLIKRLTHFKSIYIHFSAIVQV